MNNGSTSRDPPRNASSADRSNERSPADLRDVTIRPVRPDDKDRIARAFRALDPKTIYQRFFFPKQELSDEELCQLTECEAGHDVVLVATVASGDQEVIVGLGRYVRNEASAQIAFTVEEDYQGRGVAGELLRQLVDVARGNGVWQFEADVLAGNAPMLRVFERSGLPMTGTRENEIVHLTLFLAEHSEKT